MKKILILFLLFLYSFSQNTKIKIEGFSKLKLGMTDSALVSEFSDAQLINNADHFDFSDKYASLDSGGNFCNKSIVYFIPQFTLTDEIEVNSIFLTFLKNKLIDIRITQCNEDNKLKDLLVAKYGSGYRKKYSDYMEVLVRKYAKKGIPRQKVIESFASSYTFAIIWDDGNSTISQGVENDYYDFANGIKENKTNSLVFGVAITDKKGFSELISCSNADRLIKFKEYLKKTKKTSTVL